MAAKPLVPKVTQPWLVPFARWADDNAYVIDCVAENIRTALSAAAATSAVTFDWGGMRADLARYLYSTGPSRFRSFRHFCGDKLPAGQVR
jgi:hypothetical protein